MPPLVSVVGEKSDANVKERKIKQKTLTKAAPKRQSHPQKFGMKRRYWVMKIFKSLLAHANALSSFLIYHPRTVTLNVATFYALPPQNSLITVLQCYRSVAPIIILSGVSKTALQNPRNHQAVTYMATLPDRP